MKLHHVAILLSASALCLAAAPPSPRTHTTTPRAITKHNPRADTLAMIIENPMPHPVNIAVEENGKRTPLGEVADHSLGSFRIVLAGDSLTVWATNDDMAMTVHKVVRKTDPRPFKWSVSMSDD